MSLSGAGMLVLDDRADMPWVRSLVPVERWRIQGKSMEDWELLEGEGVSKVQRAKLAGESIPTAMSTAMMQRMVDRLELYRDLMTAAEANSSDTSENDD